MLKLPSSKQLVRSYRVPWNFALWELLFVVLTVEFESATYSARETQTLVAGLRLSGGTFSSSITVSVTPSEQQPVSAQGELF